MQNVNVVDQESENFICYGFLSLCAPTQTPFRRNQNGEQVRSTRFPMSGVKHNCLSFTNTMIQTGHRRNGDDLPLTHLRNATSVSPPSEIKSNVQFDPCIHLDYRHDIKSSGGGVTSTVSVSARTMNGSRLTL